MNKKSNQLRPLKFQKNYLPHAEGSCLVSMGETKVLCVATIENRVPPHAEEKGVGWVHSEYSMLPRAGQTRSARKRISNAGRTQEISRLIGRSLRAAVDLSKLYPWSITVDCDVIRADGGTRTASINGGFVALAQAIKKLVKRGDLAATPLQHVVGAVSLGIVNGKVVLDMDYENDKNAETDLNIVMTSTGKLIEVQGTAEGAPFSVTELNRMIKLAATGIRKIALQQRKILGPA